MDSINVQSLRSARNEYVALAEEAFDARIRRDQLKRDLHDQELSIRYQGNLTGTIDGKNAEARDAQEANLQRLDPKWQALSDAWRKAEDEAARKAFDADMALLSLKIAVIAVNAEIAQSGTTRLVAETDLASV